MVTMKDIARRAGVSKTAVSFVLSQRERAGGSISAATQQRVLEAAAELGYKNNELARAMTRGRSRVLGFLTRSIEAEHVARLVSGALGEADARGYFIKVMRPSVTGFDERLIDQCIELRLSGVIAAFLHPSPIDRYREALSRYNIPIALLDDAQAHPWGQPVLADYEQGMEQAVAHLVELGHRDIGFVGGDTKEVGTQHRLQALLKALKKHDLAAAPEHLIHSPWEAGEMFATLDARFAALSQPPTALVCATDATALLVMRAAQNRGWQVPRDLSVVGFGDVQVSGLSNPPLTTIHHPFIEMGALVTRQLLDRVETAQANQDDTVAALPGARVPTFLVVRESTAPRRSSGD